MSSSQDTFVSAAISGLEKTFGKGIVESMEKLEEQEVLPSIPSGSYALDEALGTGGYPRGRFIEIFGPEATGKTVLALKAIAACHKRGERCVFVDVEHSLDYAFARKLGVDASKLLVVRPDYAEQALEVVESLARSGGFPLIVLDSVAALVPKTEIEGDMGDNHGGVMSRLMGQACRKLAPVLSKTGTTLLLLNQLRMKIGVMFGNPEFAPGGKALKFFTSIRIDVRRSRTLKSGDKVTGQMMKVKVVKNLLAPPFQEVQLSFSYDGSLQDL